MSSIKTYFGLPTMRFPGWKELWDGSFLSQSLETTDQGNQTSMIKDLAGKLVRVQEVAVWASPGVSLVWVLVSQAGLYYVTSVSSTSLVSTFSYIMLSLYLYMTWAYTVWPAIRLPPSPGEDTEIFTPLCPGMMSAPEMETVIMNCKHRLGEIVAGLALLRREQPGKFCLVISSVFLMSAVLGTKLSLTLLLHSTLLALLVTPALFTRAGRNAQLWPVLETLTECLAALLELIIYRGRDAAVKDSAGKLLEEFVPETSDENTSVLSKALSWREKPEKEAEYSLTENVSIPSHDEVENESLSNLLEFEHGLQPTPLNVVDQSLGNYSDSETGEDSTAEEKLKNFHDNDTEDEDSLSLDLGREGRSLMTEKLGVLENPAGLNSGPVSSVRAPHFEEELRRSLTAGLAESVTSSVVSSALGAVTADTTQHRSVSDLEDFEIVDEDLLEEESI